MAMPGESIMAGRGTCKFGPGSSGGGLRTIDQTAWESAHLFNHHEGSGNKSPDERGGEEGGK